MTGGVGAPGPAGASRFRDRDCRLWVQPGTKEAAKTVIGAQPQEFTVLTWRRRTTRGREGPWQVATATGQLHGQTAVGQGGGAGKVHVGLHIIHSGDICGGPVVPRPNARQGRAQRHLQWGRWAHQLPGQRSRQQTEKPCNTVHQR